MRSRALARRPPRDYSERRMRIVKVLALLAPLIILILGLSTLRPHDAVWAQLPTPNPMVGPRPLPSAPAQLPAPVSTLVAPPLAPVPAPPTPAPPVTARVFNCSCFGPGSGTHFMGRVQAPTFFGARQAALSACLSFNERREPQPAMIQQRSSAGAGSSSAPSLPGGSASDAARTASQALPGRASVSTAAQLQACQTCTCD